jgi:hypothetical protein
MNDKPSSTIAPTRPQKPCGFNSVRFARVPYHLGGAAVPSAGTSCCLARSTYSLCCARIIRGQALRPASAWERMSGLERSLIARRTINTAMDDHGRILQENGDCSLLALVPVLIWFLFNVILIVVGAIDRFESHPRRRWLFHSGFPKQNFLGERQVPRSTCDDGYRRILSRRTAGALSQRAWQALSPATACRGRRDDRGYRPRTTAVADRGTDPDGADPAASPRSRFG